MALRTIVKVGGITNLGDARYCSGMGVDMLGFRVIEGDENYISPKQFQEIRGWITGPQIVAEVYGISRSGDLPEILAQYRPDYLELGIDEYRILQPEINLPVILNISSGEQADLIHADFLLSRKAESLGNLKIPVLLEVDDKGKIDDALKSVHVKGIALTGSNEIRPGLKDYQALAEILESLETED